MSLQQTRQTSFKRKRITIVLTMMNTSVEYWEFQGEEQIFYRKDAACFGSFTPIGQTIKYLCNTDKFLSKEVVSFYIDFLQRILDKNIFKCDIKENNKVMFKLETKGLTRSQALLYLTAIRELDEFPEISNELFRFKDKSINRLFYEFQKIHFLYVKNKIPFKSVRGAPCGYNHILIYDYSWYSQTSKLRPISLGEFNFRLNNPKIQGVQVHFDGTFKSPIPMGYKNLQEKVKNIVDNAKVKV